MAYNGVIKIVKCPCELSTFTTVYNKLYSLDYQ